MNKNIVLAGMLSILSLSACDNKNNENKERDAGSAPPPAPVEQTAPPPGTKQQDGTTLKVNEEGVNYESKEGGKKRSVNISKDSTSMEIKTPK